MDQYLVLLDGSDSEYTTEQRNWFLIYRDAVTADFTIAIVRVEKIDATTIVATLDQHYRYGPEKADRQVRYEAKYALTPAGWKEADLSYREIETPHFVIKYQAEVEDKAGEVGEEAEKAYASVVQKLGLLPKGKVTLNSLPIKNCCGKTPTSGWLIFSAVGLKAMNPSSCMRAAKKRPLLA